MSAKAGAPIRHTRLETDDPERHRPVWIDVWHPAVTTGLCPAVVLSPGAFGAPRNYAWLAEDLARHGYLVAGVCHFGESFDYGAGTVDPAAAVRHHERPRDCSFAIDQLLARFCGLIDPARIGALGHSSGGATAIVLAGGRLNPTAMATYCAHADARVDRGCAYAAIGGATDALADLSPTSRRDARVRAVVALDPALGPGFDPDSLAAIAIPVQIVAAIDNDFLPFEPHAGRLQRLIPRASLIRLERGEGHFVFLNQEQSTLEVHGIALYRDRAGVDREDVHARVAAAVRQFFASSLRKP